jgi:hypothetical protein
VIINFGVGQVTLLTAFGNKIFNSGLLIFLIIAHSFYTVFYALEMARNYIENLF